MYLLGLGVENLLIYDISNSKIERIEFESRVYELKQLSKERVAMTTESNIYFLVGSYIDPLFKWFFVWLMNGDLNRRCDQSFISNLASWT